MTIELKNESAGVHKFLEVINELSGIDNSLDKEVSKFAQSVKERYLKSQKKDNVNTKSKWAIVAKKMSGVLDDETAEHLLKCSQEVRKGLVLKDVEELMANNEK